MTVQEFDTARQERLRSRTPLQFVLQGDTYTCLQIVPIGDAFDLLDAPDATSEAEVSRALAAFIDKILVDDDRPRFAQALRRRDDPVDGLTLLEIVDWLGEQYAGRPTSPSADSSGGPEGAGPTSSSDADGKASETSPD